MTEDRVGWKNATQRLQVSGSGLRFLRLGAGTPLVLLHTLRTQLEYFFPLIAHLDLTRREVLAPDLPGHGESEAPSGDYSAEYFTDRIEAFLEATGVQGAVDRYVAMTRARKHLTISLYDLASRFLYEIPPELIDFTGFGKLKEEDEIFLI